MTNRAIVRSGTVFVRCSLCVILSSRTRVLNHIMKKSKEPVRKREKNKHTAPRYLSPMTADGRWSPGLAARFRTLDACEFYGNAAYVNVYYVQSSETQSTSECGFRAVSVRFCAVCEYVGLRGFSVRPTRPTETHQMHKV